jgi:hypothetical protein
MSIRSNQSGRTYEQGRADGVEMLSAWRAGRLALLPDIINSYRRLRDLDGLSEWECGVLDVWEEAEECSAKKASRG